MQCPRCHHANATDAKFCNQYAPPLAPQCPACGHENVPEAKFCNQCATPLTAQPPPPQPVQGAPPPPAAPERAPLSYTPSYLTEKILTSRQALAGERNQVTVLFADLKDSTELRG